MSRHPDRVLVAVALSAGPFVGLGLARFAYALLLPPMRAELSWTYSQAGVLNTANAIGYLVGALVAAQLAGRIGTGRAFLLGCALTTVSVLLTAVSTVYGVLLTMRLLAGIGGAWAFVLGAVLVAAAGAKGSAGRAAVMLGIYYAGTGAGMTVAGLVVPWVLDETGGTGWRLGWVMLAGMGLLATVVAGLALRHTQDPEQPALDQRSWRRRSIGWLSASYACFGLGYIAYLTFVVAYLQEQGVGQRTTAAFWVVLGLAAVGGVLAWARLLGRLGGSRSMTVVLLALAAGTVLPVIVPQTWAFFVSGIVVGGTFLSAVTAMTVGVRRLLPTAQWTSALAFTTIAFGLGQTLGPWLSGLVADRFGGLASGLVFSAGVLVIGAIVAIPQQEPRTLAQRG
ncbi:MAG: YbfB/YjiJ family MFS transporter [Ornithinimicrobium sp.]|uniref:YbfB/YjiJ family MFS transporter n=1 Tax=Ornithinimicrobium sp. TaxID=1977084 RepID=UPI0026E0C79F|nr:YbfB/YjiJ family MFS transporter [Ornithinimicrobium sp.]MDO5739672.1 YbfB/YjiJ family MFS transporter [Ornithinimicrobium sp.]